MEAFIPCGGGYATTSSPEVAEQQTELDSIPIPTKHTTNPGAGWQLNAISYAIHFILPFICLFVSSLLCSRQRAQKAIAGFVNERGEVDGWIYSW